MIPEITKKHIRVRAAGLHYQIILAGGVAGGVLVLENQQWFLFSYEKVMYNVHQLHEIMDVLDDLNHERDMVR